LGHVPLILRAATVRRLGHTFLAGGYPAPAAAAGRRLAGGRGGCRAAASGDQAADNERSDQLSHDGTFLSGCHGSHRAGCSLPTEGGPQEWMRRQPIYSPIFPRSLGRGGCLLVPKLCLGTGLRETPFRAPRGPETEFRAAGVPKQSLG